MTGSALTGVIKGVGSEFRTEGKGSKFVPYLGK